MDIASEKKPLSNPEAPQVFLCKTLNPPKQPTKKKKQVTKAEPTPINNFQTLYSLLTEKESAAFKSAHEAGTLGWNKDNLGQGCICSSDGLTITHSTESGFGGALGATLYSSGVHDFAFRVWEPVDDAFWVGVAYPDVWIDESPKQNTKTIVWSGGSEARPGTIRIHGEKMKNQPKYKHGDVIGININYEDLLTFADLEEGDLIFFLNEHRVAEWRSVLKGPVYPYFCLKHSGPGATLLQNWKEDSTSTEAVDKIRDIVGGTGVQNLPDVDGSILEGGGQVLRIALGCCALLKRPMLIHSIRAGRPKPGLGHQHSTGAKLVSDICFGMLKPEAIQYGGHSEGVTELYLWPGVKGLRGGEFHADPHTAGSITLLLQAAFPCALIGARPEPGMTPNQPRVLHPQVRMILKGGTNSQKKISPSTFYSSHEDRINLPVLTPSRGFYPLGHGEVIVDVKPVDKLNAITLLERGEPKIIRGTVYGSGTGRRAGKDISPTVRTILKNAFGNVEVVFTMASEPEGAPNTPTHVGGSKKEEKETLTMKERKAIQEERRLKFAGVAGCQLVLETTTGCLISGSALIQDTGKNANGTISAKEVAEKAANMLVENWNAGGCVDEFLMDQLVIFMAVAKGKSEVLCPGPTSSTSLHLETAIHFVELLCGAKFSVGPPGPKGEKVVSCEGIDFLGRKKA